MSLIRRLLPPLIQDREFQGALAAFRRLSAARQTSGLPPAQPTNRHA